MTERRMTECRMTDRKMSTECMQTVAELRNQMTEHRIRLKQNDPIQKN